MRCHYPDLASASDWLNQISHAARPIRSTTQIWVVTRHQYDFSALVSQTSFGEETSGSVARCRLFSPARIKGAIARVLLSGLEWYPHSFLINYSFQSILVEVRFTEWSPKGVNFNFPTCISAPSTGNSLPGSRAQLKTPLTKSWINLGFWETAHLPFP